MLACINMAWSWMRKGKGLFSKMVVMVVGGPGGEDEAEGG